MNPGFKLCPFQDFSIIQAFALSVPAFEAVDVALPVGLVTSVGIRNCYIPGSPGSHGWHSALRFSASPCFDHLTHLFPELF